MTRTTSLTTLLLVLLMASFVAGSADAATYRWVDENGVVNYSERKPRGVDAELISSTAKAKSRTGNARRPGRTPAEPAPVPSPAPAAAAPSTSELSAEQQEMMQQLQAKEQERQDQIAKIRKDNCERARRVLDNLSARGRIRLNTEDGGQRMMPEEERQQRIADAQEGIVANCDS